MSDKQINLYTTADAGTVRVNDSVQNITSPTGYMRQCDFSRLTQFLLICMRVRFGPLLAYKKAKRWTVPCRNGCWQCWKGCWGQRHHAFMVCHVRVWIETPTMVQLVYCTMRLYNSLTKSNSNTMKKVYMLQWSYMLQCIHIHMSGWPEPYIYTVYIWFWPTLSIWSYMLQWSYMLPCS